jgi:hypothetical protein
MRKPKTNTPQDQKRYAQLWEEIELPKLLNIERGEKPQ